MISVDEGGVKTERKLTETRQAEVAPALSGFSHDDDGSIAYDALNQYIYDAENRLIEIVANPGAWGGLLPSGKLLPEGAKFSRVRHAYDAQGRRVQKDVYQYIYTPAPQEVLVKRTRFVWDGWNMAKEIGYDENFQITTRAYIWGPDLSGTVEGAGGVGGLLACHLRQNPQPDPGQPLDSTFYGTMLPTYDGNGNIVSYVDAATGAVEQEEEYGPFGENLRPRSTSPKRVPFGWSTKYTDEETGLVAYQLRYYSPELGRWMSRDPIEEAGGVNLLGAVNNRPASLIDILGLDPEVAGFFNIGFGWDSKRGPYVSDISLSGGMAQDVCDDLRLRLDAEVRVYNGGPGTSIVGSGQKWYYDVTGVAYVEIASGKGAPMKQYTLNYHTSSPILDRSQNSFVFGQAWNYSSALGNTQRVGFFGFRSDNFMMSNNNDVSFYLGDGFDRGWTGGIVLQVYAGGGNYLEAGYQNFTGELLGPKGEGKRTAGAGGPSNDGDYIQNPQHMQLNRADSYVRFGRNGATLTLGLSTNGWFQQMIHDGHLLGVGGDAARFVYPEKHDWCVY